MAWLNWHLPCCALLAAMLASPAAAEEAAPPSHSRASKPTDPLSQVQGSEDSWSVSKTDAGCFLMSPYRRDSSRLALGKHAVFGLGLFAVRFPISVQGENGTEPVLISTAAGGMDKSAKVVGTNLLFIALSGAETAAALQELKDNGTLWLEIRNAWLTHGGNAIAPAIAEYSQSCAG